MLLDDLNLLPPPHRIQNGVGNCPATARVTPVTNASLGPDAYVLEINADGIRIESGSDAGAYYATRTLEQVRRLTGDALPCGRIEDHPDFPIRGVMLDISRDKVPTMATLFQIVDELAATKINHLQLYTEHTFAYRNHRDVWANASPMTAEEVRELDSYCRARHIELVPNQNTFGHMHRWLKQPRYRDLAECPDGYVTPWSEKRSDPFSFNPLDPRSVALVSELLAELLPNFHSRFVNVGGDETFDLGQGASKAECARVGKGRVYLDYLLKVHDIVRRSGHTMMFWGDIILNHPELIPELPRDLVALVWGYEANHPLDEQCAKFATAGLPFFVCPGTSGWNAIGGRTENALANLKLAAEAGKKHGASGYLITDWGDSGHWQPLPVSYPAYAAGAWLAWNTASFVAARLPALLDAHVLFDDAGVAGAAVCDLGNVYLEIGHRIHNASALFRLLFLENISPLVEKISADELRGAIARIEEVMVRLRGISMSRPDAADIAAELSLAGHMMIHGCIRALGKTSAAALSRDLDTICTDFRQRWLVRNRPGGLDDSIRRLETRAQNLRMV